jgi:ATP-binding cassette subfamily C protein LapB
LINILALATPIYVIQVLQRFVAYGNNGTLLTLVIGVVAITIFEFFFRNVRHSMVRELDIINIQLSDAVKSKLASIKTSIYAVSNQFNTKLISSQLNNVNFTFTASNIITVIDVPFTLIFITAIFLIHYQLGLIIIFFILIPFLLIKLFSDSINKSVQSLYRTSIQIDRTYDDLTSKYSTHRFFNITGIINKIWNTGLQKILTLQNDTDAKRNLLSSLMQSLMSLVTISIIAWGALLAVDGQISVGALIGANILSARAIMPIIKYAQLREGLTKSEESLNDINNLLRIPHEESGGTNIKDFKANVTINNLQVIYPKTKNPVFDGLNCKIISGDVVAVVGNNGSGKTTLINALGSILDFNRGSILLDDIEIQQISLPWYRSQIIFVPQEPKFFNFNFIDNHIGASKIKKDRFLEIIDKTDLSDFINRHPNGLEMMFENNGENLPVGIRKRMAFARGMITDGKLVILDEPTESLDDKGREAIYKLIDEFKSQEKTIIIATNDDELLKRTSKIINLDNKPHPILLRTKAGEQI